MVLSCKRRRWPVPWARARPSTTAASRSATSSSIGAWWSRPWASMRECRLWPVCPTPERATRRGHVGRAAPGAGQTAAAPGRLLAAGMRVASAGQIAAKPRGEQRGRPDWSSFPRRETSGGEGRAGIGVRPEPTAPQGPAAEHPVDPRHCGSPLPAGSATRRARRARTCGCAVPWAGSCTARATRSTAAGRRRLHPIEVAGAISQARAPPDPGAGGSPPRPRALLGVPPARGRSRRGT